MCCSILILISFPGTERHDVLYTLLPIISITNSIEIFGITSLACGLISVGKHTNEVPTSIFNKVIEFFHTDTLKSPFIRLASLGLALCYFGAREAIDAPLEAIEVLEEPIKTAMRSTLLMCAYAGTGDVLTVQQLLHIVGDKAEAAGDSKKDKKSDKKEKKDRKDSFTKIKAPKKTEWDYSMGPAIATLGVAVVTMGEDIGK